MNLRSDQLKSIFDHFELSKYYFTWQMECIGNGDKDTFIQEWISDNLYENSDYEKTLALMLHTSGTWEETEADVNDSYLVCDDREADELANDYAEDYCEDYCLGEIPTHLHHYFDSVRWVDDYLAEGRGHILNTYDGHEYHEVVNGTTYFIYGST